MSSLMADPFGERVEPQWRITLSVLGGRFTFEGADSRARDLVFQAFGGLPRHRLGGRSRSFRVSVVVPRAEMHARRTPPRALLCSGGGWLCATFDAGSFAVVDPASARALISISQAMLRLPYHARYELIELAVLSLATRAQSLVPLHAACFGKSGEGLLLMGESGAGKSTLSLHALAAGMDLLSEDSAFVTSDLRVTGVPSYLHVRPDALRSLHAAALCRHIRRSPMIRRRSGTRKYEVDLRELPGRRLAATPLRIAAVVFLAKRSAGRRPALRRIGREALLERLRDEQKYAAGLPTWRPFERRIAAVPAYELARTAHPDDAVGELATLLDDRRQ